MDMISLLLISIPIGFIGSLTGLGGASILVPLMVFFGIPVKVAIASAMASVVATSSGSASGYVRERIANVKVAMYLEMFTAVGAIIGASITLWIAPIYLYFFFAAFLMTTFITPRSKTRRSESPPASKEAKLARWLELKGSYYDEATKETVSYKADHPILGGLGMIIAGLAAGMLGIGAGAFKVTVMENGLGLPAKVASTTSSFIIGMTALAGTSVYLFSGLLNITLMAPMAIGTTVGAFVGGKVLNRLKGPLLRTSVLSCRCCIDRADALQGNHIMVNKDRPEAERPRLETWVSRVLIVGVVHQPYPRRPRDGCLYYWHSHSTAISWRPGHVHPRTWISSPSCVGLVTETPTAPLPLYLMTLGITVLILTPYVRTVMSAFYFASMKDVKYLLITLFVLVILTVSLITH